MHSDQGSQFAGSERQEFPEQHNLVPSMSRRGNCSDNADAGSFFNLLKRERIRLRTYKTRDTFVYIELFYSPQRKHVRNGMLSPIGFEKQQTLNLQAVWQTKGHSGERTQTLVTRLESSCVPPSIPHIIKWLVHVVCSVCRQVTGELAGPETGAGSGN